MADPMIPPVTLGTAGHIDHGKTALVEALTGKNTDRLPEEHRRGISIDLGYAPLKLPSGRSISVVDVPGHERFVRTMIAGASGIDLFLMVVAADDGVMPQTREHAIVLRALGLTRGVVALTKCDLVDGGYQGDLRAALGELLPGVPIVEVSAKTGAGLAALLRTIDEQAFAAAGNRAAVENWPDEPTVLHVDRVFSLRGIGTVVTGTLWSGEVRRGDQLERYPTGDSVRVRSVQVHDHPVEVANPRQRVALNLVGVGPADLERGAVLASPGAGLQASYRLDVRVETGTVGKPERGHLRAQVHHGTRACAARVVPLERGLLQLRLEAPMLARPGDRFVIRQTAPPDTLGGGVILDPAPPRHGPGVATERLKLLLSADPVEILRIALAENSGGLPSEPSSWRGHSVLGPALRRFSRERWLAGVAELESAGEVTCKSGQLAGTEPVDVPGSVEQHQPHDETAEAILDQLNHDGEKPRTPSSIANDLGLEVREVDDAVDRLVSTGDAVRLKPRIYFSRSSHAAVTTRILRELNRRGSLSIAETRDAMDTSRKYAQALLEHLDAEGVTIRRGDRHYLRRH